MGRATVIITGPATRQKAAHYVAKAPAGTRITFARSKRTLPQNDLLWAALTDVATQVLWHGIRLSPDDWKDMFSAAMKRSRVVPGLDGGFVVLGQRTSEMTVEELSGLIEMIHAFGAERGVVFGDAA